MQRTRSSHHSARSMPSSHPSALNKPVQVIILNPARPSSYHAAYNRPVQAIIQHILSPFKSSLRIQQARQVIMQHTASPSDHMQHTTGPSKPSFSIQQAPPSHHSVYSSPIQVIIQPAASAFHFTVRYLFFGNRSAELSVTSPLEIVLLSSCFLPSVGSADNLSITYFFWGSH